MQRVLSKDLWTEVRRRARTSKSRKAAIAYATRDLVGFRKGDTLVVDASTLAIRNGETDAPLLRKLHRKGVQLYACADLHAKILLLDDVAIISSGNMSSNSEHRMVEAALISDHGSILAGVASLMEQLVQQSSPLDAKQIAQLCKIEVIRRGGWNGVRPKGRKTRIAKLGNRTWIVGVRELERNPKPEEQKLIDRATRFLKGRLDFAEDDLSWIRWGVRGRLRHWRHFGEDDGGQGGMHRMMDEGQDRSSSPQRHNARCSVGGRERQAGSRRVTLAAFACVPDPTHVSAGSHKGSPDRKNQRL